MKRITTSVVLGFFILLVPPHLSAQSDLSHFSTKPVIYSSQKDNLDNSDKGVNGGVTLGRPFDEDSWAGMDIGYFSTEQEDTFAEQANYIALAGQTKSEFDFSPVNPILKGVFPIDKWEFFGFRGIGAYFVWGDVKPSLTSIGSSLGSTPEDRGRTLGTQLGLGLHYDITPRIIFGVEGTCLWTSDAKFENTFLGAPPDSELRMSGMLAAGIFAIRF
jgi:hypothetical protein